MTQDEPGREADLIDLGELSLADLKELDDSVLGHALRRVLGDPGEAIAAFESYIDGPG